MMVTLITPLAALTSVGKVTASRFKTLGLSTVEDLLFYFPTRYDDFRICKRIRDIQPGDMVTVRGAITSLQNKVTRYKRQKITEGYIQDDTGALKLVWFNQPYLVTQLTQGEVISVSGKVEYTGYGLEMRSPEWEKGASSIHTGRLAPVYPLTAGLTQKQVRFLVSRALEAIGEVEEWMVFQNQKSKVKNQNENPKVKNELTFQFTNVQLLDIRTAIKNVHFPESTELLEKARHRLKFDELFILQVRKALTRHEIRSAHAPEIDFHENEIKKFVAFLPFTLTNAQRKAAWQIIRDMQRATPMNRLLQGDVGSGKTVVALMAMFNCVLHGYQAVLMAPTEILAKQHFQSVCRFLKGWEEIGVALWTRSANKIKNQNEKIKMKIQKSKILETVESGEIDIIIGTHTLIQKDVKFNKLGLAIVDEQHRFGVEQRKMLKNKGNGVLSPHFLSMTATPIPRSLALTVYGDLDISILDEMPKGRKKIVTTVVAQKDRHKAYAFIENQIKEGRQVFVICPLIDESDTLGVKAVTSEYEKLDKEIFPRLKIGLLHGKLKDTDKDAVQEKFSKREFDILVSTSVVEVGVDVQNASVMMIEGAERFGLAQLHQFRGRVGRSEHQSYCFLFTDVSSQGVYERLDFLTRTTDGFKIAEFDLKLRGAGNIYGKEQHGIPEFKIASFDDYELIETTQEIARALINDDPYVSKYPALAKKIQREGATIHME